MKWKLIWLLLLGYSSYFSKEIKSQNGPLESQRQSNNLSVNSSDMLYIFSYPVVGRTYVMGKYNFQTEELYLPIVEIFSLLGINMEISRDKNVISGTYLLGGESYTIDYNNYTIDLAGKQWDINANLIIKGPADIYLHTDLLSTVFKLHFEGDINRLLLSLRTPNLMPVVELANRRNARNSIGNGLEKQEYYSLLYDRDYKLLNGGMFDYNIGILSDMTVLKPNYNFQYLTGIELLGGQFRGRHNALYNTTNGWQNGQSTYDWEFNLRDNSLLSEIFAGNLATRGFNSESILGMGFTNQPIEPRQMFGYTYVEGTTIADSEVELFINNQLIDYTIADAQGFYRLDVPLRYGTSKIRVQVFTPNGELKTEEKEMQIPYSFAPKGVINYQVFGGYIRDEINNPLSDKRFAGSADINIGLTRWLTLNTGYSRSNNINANSSLFTGASARILNSLLLDLEYVPNVWYKANSSLVFGVSNALSSSFTRYIGLSDMNTRNANFSMLNSIFYNFPFENLSLGVRFAGVTYGYQDGSDTRFTSDLFTQLGRFNLRINYSNTFSFENGSMIQNRDMDSYKFSGTYSFAGMQNPLLKSMFLRSSVLFSQGFNRLDQIDLQLSRRLFKSGRFTVNFSNSFLTNNSFVQIGVNFNISKWARSSTNTRTDFQNVTVQQRIRGSLGVDHKNRYLNFTDRQQVGRSAATIRLFVDNDQNGTFSRGDAIIPHEAVNIDRSGMVSLGKDGLIRLSHLQSDYRYNLSIDRKAIPNPLLVPDSKFKEFSFIADPNQYKIIDVPFYQAGVIEGIVKVRNMSGDESLGGLRLKLTSLDTDFVASIRTFRDGSFYQMDIPPGKYALMADRIQLELLGLIQESGAYEVEVKKVPNGDFIQGIEIILISNTQNEEGITYDGNTQNLNERQKVYEEELRFDLARALTYFTSAQQSYYLLRYDRALDYIENSLALFVTSHALSVKGSILYSMGDQQGAAEAWREAERMDPDLLLPNASLFLLNE